MGGLRPPHGPAHRAEALPASGSRRSSRRCGGRPLTGICPGRAEGESVGGPASILVWHHNRSDEADRRRASRPPRVFPAILWCIPTVLRSDRMSRAVTAISGWCPSAPPRRLTGGVHGAGEVPSSPGTGYGAAADGSMVLTASKWHSVVAGRAVSPWTTALGSVAAVRVHRPQQGPWLVLVGWHQDRAFDP